MGAINRWKQIGETMLQGIIIKKLQDIIGPPKVYTNNYREISLPYIISSDKRKRNGSL